MSMTRVRSVNPIRMALEQAMGSPGMQQAAKVFMNALIDESETILRARYAGEQVRMYLPKASNSRDERDARDRRILAALGAGEPPALVAAREGRARRPRAPTHVVRHTAA